MRLFMRPVQPCIATKATPHDAVRCCSTITQLPSTAKSPEKWERFGLRDSTSASAMPATLPPPSEFTPVRIDKRFSHKWREYQGVKNWEGLLDPLDNHLRQEIIRYGHFVEASYEAFDFDPSSPSYASSQFPKSSFLDRSGLSESGYRVTKYLHATSGIQLPRWIEKAPKWVCTQSSWIGYVAVCEDPKEISRLGRRDVVIALRGTTTCLEWLENLRVTLTPVDDVASVSGEPVRSPLTTSDEMVESGFLSLYTSSSSKCKSLQYSIREEISRILKKYGDEELSLTITGHSLGAALATLAAHDIQKFFKRAPPVTVISFGGPRVGNRSFQHRLEKQGTKVLRIVNSDDLITKVPGFVINEDGGRQKTNDKTQKEKLSSWIQKFVHDTQWVYADIGQELRLSSRSSPSLGDMNIASCHDLKTYLYLVNGFVSSNCPFRATARRVLNKTLA